MMNTNTNTAATITPDAIRAALTAHGIDPATAAAILADAYTAPLTAAEIGTACRVHATHHSDSGKLAGMISYGTGAAENPRCKARRTCALAICAHCYADALLKQRTTLAAALRENAAVYTDHIFTPAETPRPAAGLPVRFESFGDSIDSTHAANHILTARRNPDRVFAVWSKNPDHYAAALDRIGGTWPENLSFVYSVPVMDPANVDEIAARIKTRYGFVQYVFVVYSTRATARAAGHPINCAHRQCRTCLRCYSPRPLAAAPVIVAELLKSRQNAETRKAHAAARTYLQENAPHLTQKQADEIRRAAVRTAATLADVAALAAGHDVTPDEIAAETLRAIARTYPATA